MPPSANAPVVVIGAGPAGLTAAYDLTRRGVPTIVFEQETQVGGLAKTIVHNGFRFDIGGHRFFTKVPGVRELWRELIGDDLLARPRLSRIYYRGRFFDYPLKARNVLANIGPLTGAAVLAFEYPRLGPGMMWDACRDRVVQAGGTVTLGARIVEIAHDARAVTAVVVDLNGERRVQPASHVISTMPMRDLIAGVAPAAPEHVRRAAARLTYRDFLTVALVVDQADVFPDNWIYVHDPSVRVGRVQNFKNWSAA